MNAKANVREIKRGVPSPTNVRYSGYSVDPDAMDNVVCVVVVIHEPGVSETGPRVIARHGAHEKNWVLPASTLGMRNIGAVIFGLK